MERPRPDPEALLAHEAFLRRIARPLVRDEGVVDDIVQDTWLTALKKQPRDASRLRQWLGTVAKNLALRSRRAEERRARREQAAARPEDDDVVARVARHQKIVDAVLSLDEPYRTVVLLRFYDGLSSDEIGARSGISGAGVRKRLAKALELLRAKLDELHGDRRAWGAVLLPFLVAPRLKPAALVGGIVMGTKAKLGLAALLLLALLGTLWSVARQQDAPARGESASSRPVVEAPVPSVPPDPLHSTTEVDRDRDVHGVVVRRDGTPVPGAVVEAVHFPWRRVLHLNHDRRFDERAGPRTRTAPDGTFVLRLDWGDLVQVRASAPGFATADRPLVQAGERVRIVLAPPVLVAVHVTDAAGRPVEGARVQLVPTEIVPYVGGESTVPRSRREGVTGEDGRVAWEDLPDEGRASVYVFHRSRASAQRWIDIATDRDVEIVLGDGIAIRGRVLDALTLRPVAGAVVDTLGEGPRKTSTDAEGRYSLAGLKSTTLKATAPGYADAGVQVGEGGRWYMQFWPERKVDEADEIDFLLVRAEVVTGRIVDLQGAPVAGAFLTCRSPRILSISCESGTDGRFRIEVGLWSARAPSGIATGDTAEAPTGDGRHQLHVFAKGFGRARVSFDARQLDLGDIVLPVACAIEGRVLTPAGDPIPGAPVLLSNGLMESRRADDLGRFRFKDLEPGGYILSTHPAGAPAMERTVELIAGGRVVADLRFASLKPFTVHVRTEDGAPVKGATVYVATGFRMSQAATGEDGRATVSVTGTPRMVSVDPPALAGELRYRRPSMVHLEGNEQDATFVLVADGLVRGRVESPEGRPVAMAHLEARQGGRVVAHGVTRPDGTFQVQVPREGSIDLFLTGGSSDPDPARDTSRLLRGDIPGIRAGASGLVLRARAVDAIRTLRVRVLSPDGEPVEAAVTASPTARRVLVATQDGVAELKGLPAEEVDVWVVRGSASDGSTPPRLWLNPKPVRAVPAGQEVTLRFRDAVIIAGTVLLPDGKAAQHATVAALRNKEEVATCTAGADGGFALALEPGTKGPVRLQARVDLLTDAEYQAVLHGIEPGAIGVEIRLSAVR